MATLGFFLPLPNPPFLISSIFQVFGLLLLLKYEQIILFGLTVNSVRIRATVTEKVTFIMTQSNWPCQFETRSRRSTELSELNSVSGRRTARCGLGRDANWNRSSTTLTIILGLYQQPYTACHLGSDLNLLILRY